MAEETEKELLITLDFSGTKKKFADIGELREFMQSQRDAWSWLEQVAREDDNLAQVWEPFKGYFMQVVQFIEVVERHPDDQTKQTEQINILKSQTQIAVDQGFTLADTPSARFVLDLKDDKSPQVAGYALASLNKEKINPDDPAANEGAYWAMQYLQGSVQQRWTDRFEKQHEDLKEKNEQLIRETTELRERTVSHMIKAEEQVTIRASEFEQLVNEKTNVFTNQLDNVGERLKRQATELIEQSDLLIKRIEAQADNQAIMLEQQVANQERRFGEQFAELKEKTDILTKKAEEQTTRQAIKFRQQAAKHENDFYNQRESQERRFNLLTRKTEEQTKRQATISKQQNAKHRNLLKNQRDSQAYKFRQQTLKYENDFSTRSNSQERRFKAKVGAVVKEFDKLHTLTVENFKEFEKFLSLSAPYHVAARFWRKKQEEHKNVGIMKLRYAKRVTYVTALIFAVTVYYLYVSNTNIKTDFGDLIDIMMPDASANTPTHCDALDCNLVTCNPILGASGLCGAEADNPLACNLAHCGSANCNPVDCKAVDCKAVNCKAVDCKTVDCKAVPCNADPCKAASSTSTDASPTVNVENVIINDYIDKQVKIDSLLLTATSSTATSSITTSSTINPSKNANNPLIENIWKISVLLMISTIGFWLTRLTTKIYISNQHLEMDSNERATLLFTYFSLLNSKQPLTDSERPIVLETIFRAGTTGLSKDDGPTPVYESVIKAFVKAVRKN